MKMTFGLLCFFALFSFVSSVAIEGDIYNSQYCNGSIYAKYYFNPIGCVQYSPGVYYQVIAANSSFSVSFCNDSTCASCYSNGTFPLDACIPTNDTVIQYANFTGLQSLPDSFGAVEDDNVIVYFGNDTNCTYPGSANEIDVYAGGCQLQVGADNSSNFYSLIKCSGTNITFYDCLDSNCTNCTVYDSQPTNQCVNSTFGGGYSKFYCGATLLNEYGACNSTGNERCVKSDTNKYQTCDHGFWQPYQSCQAGLVCNPSGSFVYCITPTNTTATATTGGISTTASLE